MNKELFLTHCNNENICTIDSIIETMDKHYQEHKKVVDDIIYRHRMDPVNVKNKNISQELKGITSDLDFNIRRKIKPLLNILTYRYSIDGIRYEWIFNNDSKSMYNGSDDRTKNRIYQATLYQMLDHIKWINELTEEQFAYLCKLYILSLIFHINNSITYNKTDTYGNVRYNYEPYDKYCIELTIGYIKEDIYKQSKSYIEVTGITGTKYEITLSNVEKNIDKDRLFKNKETVVKCIDCYVYKFKHKPTCKELMEYINDYLKNISSTLTIPSQQYIMKYIKKYELQDMMNIRERNTSRNMLEKKRIALLKELNAINELLGKTQSQSI